MEPSFHSDLRATIKRLGLEASLSELQTQVDYEEIQYTAYSSVSRQRYRLIDQDYLCPHPPSIYVFKPLTELDLDFRKNDYLPREQWALLGLEKLLTDEKVTARGAAAKIVALFEAFGQPLESPNDAPPTSPVDPSDLATEALRVNLNNWKGNPNTNPIGTG